MSYAGTYVIVGASLAGVRAAEALRERGFGGEIVVGAEPDRPYERTPLSKGFLQGAHPEENVFLRPPEYCHQNAISLWLGVRATRLDPHERVVLLDGGDHVQYAKLLISSSRAASFGSLASPAATWRVCTTCACCASRRGLPLTPSVRNGSW